MVSAIVLAAGLSTRMEERNKLLLKFRGESILRIVVTRLLAAGPGEVIVVTGHEEESVRSSLDGLKLSFVRNEHYQQGMTSSIQAGVAEAKGAGLMICLADMYAIQTSEYHDLIRFFEDERKTDPAVIVIPEFRGSKGNPVIFSEKYRNDILAHRDPEGCRKIVIDNQSHLKKLPMAFDHVLQDLDYPADYIRLLNSPG